MRIEHHNLDGRGTRRTHVYDLASISPDDYWPAVTDVQCPCCRRGIIRWAEAGYAPGYRICDGCGRHYLADGTLEFGGGVHAGITIDLIGVEPQCETEGGDTIIPRAE